MESINLKFTYSIDSETSRLTDTIMKLQWLRDNGYKPDLPESFDPSWTRASGVSLILKKQGRNVPIENRNIKTAAIGDYDGDYFEKKSSEIEEEWRKISEDVVKKFDKFKIKLESTYWIQLTRYGIKGNCFLPNKIILNVNHRPMKEMIRTIIHEIIHLTIENWVQEYHLSHWQSERLADLVFDKVYPELNRMRCGLPEKTKKIDASFKKYFPDLELVIKNR